MYIHIFIRKSFFLHGESRKKSKCFFSNARGSNRKNARQVKRRYNVVIIFLHIHVCLYFVVKKDIFGIMVRGLLDHHQGIFFLFICIIPSFHTYHHHHHHHENSNILIYYCKPLLLDFWIERVACATDLLMI